MAGVLICHGLGRRGVQSGICVLSDGYIHYAHTAMPNLAAKDIKKEGEGP